MSINRIGAGTRIVAVANFTMNQWAFACTLIVIGDMLGIYYNDDNFAVIIWLNRVTLLAIFKDR